MEKAKYDRLIERREDIRMMMKKAFANVNMVEYDKLNVKFQKLDKKIRKVKK